jgi:hypothetical protein
MKGVKRKKIIFTIILFIPLCYLSFGAEKRALLIGINDYLNLPLIFENKKIEDLQGPLNDVRIIKGVLVSFYEFEENNIKVLTEKEATRENIVKSINEWLVEGTKEGDMVFFYYSGHGTRIEDQNGDEEDGYDEALCPVDVKPRANDILDSKLILDDELGELFRKLRGRDVIAIVDACHSATVTTRGKGTKQLEDTPGVRARFIPVRIAHPEMRLLQRSIPVQRDIPEGQIFLFSSREDQKSFEFNYPDGFHGIFTFNLCELLKKQKFITYIELYQQVKKIIREKSKKGFYLEQEPQIEPKEGEILEKVIFTAFKAPIHPQKQPIVPGKIEPFQAPPELKGEKVLLRVEDFKGANTKIMNNLKVKLGNLPHVEITETSFFDRLIRGEIKNGLFYSRIVNRLGDAFIIQETPDVDDLVRRISSHLEYTYIVKQLATITNPNPPFKVRVWITEENREDFFIGERVSFNFLSEKDCYLLLLNLDSKGNFQVLFPNKYYQNNFVKGGKEITIPDENMRKEFELEFYEPEGEETVKAIATTEPINLENIGIQNFESLFDTTGSISVPIKTRGALIENLQREISSGKFQWSEDTVVIRTHKSRR